MNAGYISENEIMSIFIFYCVHQGHYKYLNTIKMFSKLFHALLNKIFFKVLKEHEHLISLTLNHWYSTYLHF